MRTLARERTSAIGPGLGSLNLTIPEVGETDGAIHGFISEGHERLAIMVEQESFFREPDTIWIGVMTVECLLAFAVPSREAGWSSEITSA